MPGMRIGGLKTAQILLKKNPDYYRELGRKGGTTKGKPKGFAYLKAHGQEDKIRAAGKKGGRISKRNSKIYESDATEWGDNVDFGFLKVGPKRHRFLWWRWG